MKQAVLSPRLFYLNWQFKERVFFSGWPRRFQNQQIGKLEKRKYLIYGGKGKKIITPPPLLSS